MKLRTRARRQQTLGLGRPREGTWIIPNENTYVQQGSLTGLPNCNSVCEVGSDYYKLDFPSVWAGQLFPWQFDAVFATPVYGLSQGDSREADNPSEEGYKYHISKHAKKLDGRCYHHDPETPPATRSPFFHPMCNRLLNTPK